MIKWAVGSSFELDRPVIPIQAKANMRYILYEVNVRYLVAFMDYGFRRNEYVFEIFIYCILILDYWILNLLRLLHCS